MIRSSSPRLSTVLTATTPLSSILVRTIADEPTPTICIYVFNKTNSQLMGKPSIGQMLL